MISVILPVYNGEKYLSKAIASILAQTYQDWELILVNDCSTDHTPDICAEFAAKDTRIHVLTNETNQKLPRSLNRGFAESRGEYLTWTSDDNLYEKNAFEVYLHEIEQGYDLIYTDITYIDTDGRELPRKKQDIRIWQGNCVEASFLYRREVYQKIGDYREDMFLVEDYDYWLRAARCFKLHFCPEKVYRYREHAGSLTSRRYQEIRRMRIQLLEEQLDCLIVPEEGKDDIRIQLLEDYAKEDRMKDFRKVFLELKKRGKMSVWRLSGSQRMKYLFGSKFYHWQKRIRGKE